MNSTNSSQIFSFKSIYSLEMLPYLILNTAGIFIGTLGKKNVTLFAFILTFDHFMLLKAILSYLLVSFVRRN
jgi:hypothetical protein